MIQELPQLVGQIVFGHRPNGSLRPYICTTQSPEFLELISTAGGMQSARLETVSLADFTVTGHYENDELIAVITNSIRHALDSPDLKFVYPNRADVEKVLVALSELVDYKVRCLREQQRAEQDAKLVEQRAAEDAAHIDYFKRLAKVEAPEGSATFTEQPFETPTVNIENVNVALVVDSTDPAVVAHIANLIRRRLNGDQLQ